MNEHSTSGHTMTEPTPTSIRRVTNATTSILAAASAQLRALSQEERAEIKMQLAERMESLPLPLERGE